MSKEPFFKNNFSIMRSEYPSNYIPADAKPITSMDLATGDDHTCVANLFIKDGVIHLQEVKFYDNEGNEICHS